MEVLKGMGLGVAGAAFVAVLSIAPATASEHGKGRANAKPHPYSSVNVRSGGQEGHARSTRDSSQHDQNARTEAESLARERNWNQIDEAKKRDDERRSAMRRQMWESRTRFVRSRI